VKVILDQDIVRNVVLNGGIEVGPKPKDVGLERLRFDGKRLVDLATLQEIWVKQISPEVFELHAVPVEGAQLVAMTYRKRRRLTADPDGTIRLKTPEEMDAEMRRDVELLAKNEYRRRLREWDDLEDRIERLYQLVFMVINYIETGDQSVKSALDALLPDIRDAYPLEEYKDRLTADVKAMKAALETYHQEIASITSRG